MISARCENLLASRCAPKDETSSPTVAAVKTTPVPIALYPRTVLQEDRYDERDSHEDEPLGVLGDQGEIGRPVAKQRGRQQRFLPRPLARADVEEEAGQERGSDQEEQRHQGVVCAGLEDPEDDEEHARGAERIAPTASKGRVGSGGRGIDEAPAEKDDRRDDRRLEDERRPPADSRGDHASDQRAGRGADPSQPTDHAESPAHAT